MLVGPHWRLHIPIVWVRSSVSVGVRVRSAVPVGTDRVGLEKRQCWDDLYYDAVHNAPGFPTHYNMQNGQLFIPSQFSCQMDFSCASVKYSWSAHQLHILSSALSMFGLVDETVVRRIPASLSLAVYIFACKYPNLVL